MYIVMKDGPKKGEIQEMKFAVARDLINAGRAEQYFFEEKPLHSGPIEVSMPVVQQESPTPIFMKKKKGKK